MGENIAPSLTLGKSAGLKECAAIAFDRVRAVELSGFNA